MTMQDTKNPCHPLPDVSIDHFTLDLSHDRITAYVAVEGEEEAVIFSINQGDFEKFCDDNELRDYEVNLSYGGLCEADVTCTHSWPEVYDGYELMEKFLKQYIEFSYEQEAMNIEAPLKNILSSHKHEI